MATQNIIDNSTQSIIKRYTILYKAIFQYSIYFIPLILGVVRAWTLQSTHTIARTQIPKNTKIPSYSESNGIYKAIRLSDEVGPIFNGFGDVKILGGELQATGGVIIGRNNLITLGGTNGGIILPNRPYVINMSFTGGLEYFTNKDYDINELKWVMDNWILSLAPTGTENTTGGNYGIDSMFFRTKEKNNQAATNMEEVLKILKERSFFEQLEKGVLNESTSSTDIKNAFTKEHNLTCLFGWRVINQFCDINIDRLIKAIPEIDLDNTRKDLVFISREIKRVDQVDAFCSNLMTNVLRKPYPTAELDRIMAGTCKLYENRYEKLKLFLGVQNEIESLVGENIVGSLPDYNIFKLVSIQQKLYSQHKDRLLDTNTVNTYLRFVNNLINEKSIKIPQFYIEATYYFNNVYLQNMLKRLTIQSINPLTNDEVTKILDNISSINKGNPSVGIIGLDQLIINTSLKKDIATITGSFFNSIQNFEQVFTDMLKTFPEIRISSVETDESTNTARLVGVIKFIQDGENSDSAISDPVQTIIDFEYKDGYFHVTSLRIPDNNKVDEIINSYLAKNTNNAGLGTLLYLIKTSINHNDTKLDICNTLLSIPTTDVINCSINSASILINGEAFTLNINNNIIVSAIASNVTRQELVNKLVNNQNINQDRIPGVIEGIYTSIIGEKDIDNDVEGSVDAEKIALLEKFKKFLGVEPENVQKNGDKRLVSFTLNKYEFATIVDIKNNYKLSPLVIQAGGKNITITNFSLSLINLQQQKINKFVDDPLLFIKQIDPNRYNQIDALINNKNE